MGKHDRQSDHRIAHTALLTLSILSIGSPIGLLMGVAPPKVNDEPTIDSLDTDWLALPQGPPVFNLVPMETPTKNVVQATTASAKNLAQKKEKKLTPSPTASS